MTQIPLRLAVVGHTNTGKTSLLRTLLRNPHFGEVRDEAGTTRHVESARLMVDGQVIMELFDTPGLEDSMALLDALESQFAGDGRRRDGPDMIAAFLDSPQARGRFEQEARVLRTLLGCDAGLYVIDARDPVLAKHRDELRLLSYCGRPVLPSLNFTREPGHQIEAWREALARLGLHVIVEFDTVAPALDGEQQLYERLSVLMDRHAASLQALTRNVVGQRMLRRMDGCRLIADMLIDVAALRLMTPADDAAVQQASTQLREQVRTREQACVQGLLRRYRFETGSAALQGLSLQGERWEMDLFHPQALKEMGIHVGRGMAAGAVAGATVDVFLGGLSLGAATLIGATAGGVWQGMDRWGRRLLGRLQGHRELTVDDPVLCLLIVRQLALLQALERRGHAARDPVMLDTAETGDGTDSTDNDAAADYRRGALPEALEHARAHPQWSALAPAHAPSAQRETAMQQLADRLAQSLA
ncbi:MAG: DUF3482 domain-containing protein [Castellaniella sp.]